MTPSLSPQSPGIQARRLPVPGAPRKAPPLFLSGFGHYFPDEVLDNRFFVETGVDTTEEWIESHLGIQERRRAPAEHDTSHLGARSLEDACRRTGWKPADLDLVVLATSTPDALIPATASFCCKHLGIDPVAFDINAACSGFIYGLAVAQGLVGSLGSQRAALVTAEKYTRVTDYSDRSSCVFFGDGAATVLLQAERPSRGFELVDLLLENRNQGADMVTTPVGGCFRQEGRAVKEHALQAFVGLSREILERNGATPAGLRGFVGHQANLRVLETVAAELGVTPEQHWSNVRWKGNQGAAGCATSFVEGVLGHLEELRDGDLVLCTVFGSGFTSGSALLRWTATGA